MYNRDKKEFVCDFCGENIENPKEDADFYIHKTLSIMFHFHKSCTENGLWV